MKKGCLYWLLIGWWWEIMKLYFKLLYWICIGWWWKLLNANPEKREIKKINKDLDRINSNLDNLEKQIDDMLASAVTVPYTALFDNMEGHDFEYFCADVLKKNGFENVEVTQGSGDQGIDILATKDGIKYGIQCKCYSSDISNKAVQEAFSGKAFYNCHVGVVLTNRYFTASAKELAEKNGILLWDRNKLNEIIEKGNNT